MFLPRWALVVLLALTLVAATTSDSEAYDYVNLLIGNGGDTPNGSGGMIPSVAPPFAMTRWVAQTHLNFVSRTPYNHTASTIHGFQATRQPAIWMGESGPVVIVPGVDHASRAGEVKIENLFERRGLKMKKETEVITPAYYAVALDDGADGEVLVEQSATSRVGHLRITFTHTSTSTPYIFVEASRPSIITSDPTNVTYPHGSVSLSLHPKDNSRVHEICGSDTERQDWIITPTSIKNSADTFKGYFCARFEYSSTASPDGIPNTVHGIVQNGTTTSLSTAAGPLVGGWAAFPPPQSQAKTQGKVKTTVTIRVGTSFISEAQAAFNIDDEIRDGAAFEETVRQTREKWVEKLDRFKIEGATEEQKKVFWTGVVHALQYPSEQHEPSPPGVLTADQPFQSPKQYRYFSGYDGNVHTALGYSGESRSAGESYTGYSIWDTYRSEWAFLILAAPERVPGMVRSMLADYKEGGWLPMWKNIVETNIMIATHADSLIAEAVVKGVTGFDVELAWEAVWKDANVPPVKDWTVSYYDREENVDYEVRAGLSSVYNDTTKGWVADDVHSESASRTLGFAYDDYAAAQLATALNKPVEIPTFLHKRSVYAPFTLYNDATGFMEARNQNGTWAGEDAGWTEGDKWAYTFDVVHAIPELVRRRGGNESFVKSLDEHFDGGHNEHSNEPSHHIPYLYALAGAAYKTQERVREVAQENYGDGPEGLSGNEDCGQMSAWYIFSAMGFYPVNPASGEYVVGSPFFEKLTIDLPPRPSETNAYKLTIVAEGAQTKPYVKSLTVNGRKISAPIIKHGDIKDGGELVFEMSDKIERWGNEVLFGQSREEGGTGKFAGPTSLGSESGHQRNADEL